MINIYTYKQYRQNNLNMACVSSRHAYNNMSSLSHKIAEASVLAKTNSTSVEQSNTRILAAEQILLGSSSKVCQNIFSGQTKASAEETKSFVINNFRILKQLEFDLLLNTLWFYQTCIRKQISFLDGNKTNCCSCEQQLFTC